MSKTNGPAHWAWLKRAVVVLSLVLVVEAAAWAIPLALQTNAAQLAAYHNGPLLQTTAPPAPGSFQTTLEELGYGEAALASPWGSTSYSFRLPDNWLVSGDSYFDLEFSYFFTALEARSEDELGPTFFGELSIRVDGRLLQLYSLNEPTLERVQLRTDLPPEIFNETPGKLHVIRVDLDAWSLCNALHKAQLIIHPESVLVLNYTSLSPVLDLAAYPRPFYQTSFDPDQVRFVLPAQPSETEMRGAAVVAAGLGALTGNKMVISTTTDVDWLRMVDTAQGGSEHLFVIGQPGRNQLITWLNDYTTLPIPAHHRELALSMQGPAAVMPGDAFTYTMTVTNTTSAPVLSLSLINHLPYQAALLSCRPVCTETGRNEISWQLASLSVNEVASFSLTLRLTDTAQLSPQTRFVENSVTLVNQAQEPLNVSSLTTAVGPASPPEELALSSGQDDYFFIQQDGQPVPEGDGILQEVISPWDPQKVILLVTGVNEAAVYKASQSLGLGTRFPDTKGPVALVHEIRPSPPGITTMATDLTLADLGYTDQTVYGTYDTQEVAYWVSIPLNWRLTSNAYLRLLFSHSAVLDMQRSTLSVLFNGTPLSTVALDQGNATEGSLQVSLPPSNVRPGASNRITILILMEISRDRCLDTHSEQAWVSISRDSVLHLDHRVQDIVTWDLGYFPFPFDTQADLGNVLFVLPLAPGLVEQETLLRLASVLGNAARGTVFSPAVSFGGSLDATTLSRYHIIAIGRPSANPLIQQVNYLLPQPFVPGADEVECQAGEVLLRLPPGTPLGYIQELPSPWNDRQALMVVTGTTDEGVIWTTYVLDRQTWRLRGNLALVRGGEKDVEVRSMDTRGLTSAGLTSTMATAMPELTPAATITPTLEAGTGSQATPTPPPPSARQGKSALPIWAMFFIGATAVVVVGIFGVVAWRFRQRQG